MTDRALAGAEDAGSYSPSQLFAGENDVITTHGTVKTGQAAAVLGTTSSGRQTKWAVMALDANNKLVPWNPAQADVAVTGGATSQTAKAPETKPYAILAHQIDTSAAGTNADTEAPIYIGGVFNFDALLVPNGTTRAQLQAAFAQSGNSNVVIQDIYGA